MKENEKIICAVLGIILGYFIYFKTYEILIALIGVIIIAVSLQQLYKLVKRRVQTENDKQRFNVLSAMVIIIIFSLDVGDHQLIRVMFFVRIWLSLRKKIIESFRNRVVEEQTRKVEAIREDEEIRKEKETLLKIYFEKLSKLKNHSEMNEKTNDKVFFDREIKRNELSVVEEIKKKDFSFNSVLFLKLAHNIAVELIKTQITKIKSAMDTIDAFKNDEVVVDCPVYVSFSKKDAHFELKLQIMEYYKIEECDINDGEIIILDGKKKNLYEMTFVKPLSDVIKTRSCPRCGAPLKKEQNAICKYCFKFSLDTEKEEIKSNITKFSYDIPIIKFEKIMPHSCLNCGAPLKEELKGFCEYCNSNNNPADNKWILVQFEKIKEEYLEYPSIDELVK